MNQHFFSSCCRRRGFSSASAIGIGGGVQISKSSIYQPFVTTTCRVGGNNTSRSFHNFGETQRISFCTGHQRRNYGGGDLGRIVGHSILTGGLWFGSPASGHFGSYRGERIHEISTNKELLEPLYLGVNPYDREVKTHEKEQINDLNNQFACFIDKVRSLEQKNQMLHTKWELLQNQTIPMVRKDLKPLCENYICNLRKKLDCLLCEKNKLEKQHSLIQRLIEENRCKYEKELNCRIKAENEFILLKQEVDSAYKHQKKLELKKDLLKENIEFLRAFFAEELAVLDYRLYDTSVVVNMDNSRGLDMDALIQKIESWYQSIARRSKEEVNLFYQNQIVDLQHKQCQFHENLKNNNSEIAELNRVIQIMQCQVESGKKKVTSLKAAIGDTEQHGDRALKNAQAKQMELQNSLQNAKDRLATLLRDYQELMNTKLALTLRLQRTRQCWREKRTEYVQEHL